MNPIFRREFLARWRDKRSHLLLLVLTLVLGIAAYLCYSAAIEYNFSGARVATESVTARSSRVGHGLFSVLAIGNVAAWFVMAPLLLATGVARERERGLLESLQLSPMRPASQIAARTLSALAYLAMLQLVTLPIYFVAFSFGGVSQGEILRVWAIVAMTAFCGTGLGLALSAQSPRPSGALFGAVAVLVVWSLLASFSDSFSLWLWYAGLGSYVPIASNLTYFAHPLALAWNLCEFDSAGVGTTWPLLARWGAEDAFPWALLAWGTLGVMALIKATRDVTRPLPHVGWAGRNTLIQKWKTRREERLKAQREKQLAKVSKMSVEGALLADLPFDRLIRFKNPLLNREVRSRFRLRRASPWVWTGRTAIFLATACVWVMVFFTVFFDPTGRTGAVPMVLWCEWLLGIALVGTFASSAFAREREAGTWEGIRLSLIDTGDVTFIKWLSPLVAFAFLSCPLWLFLPILVPLGSWNGTPFRWIALGALVVTSSLACISALGSWISVRAKSTANATCWTTGVLLTVFLAAPFATEYFEAPRRLALWHYGLSEEFINSPANSPAYLALYTKQTGMQPAPPGNTSLYPTPAQLQQWNQYNMWYARIRGGVEQESRILQFWNLPDVLSTLQERERRPQSFSDANLYLSDNATGMMACLHVALAFCVTGALLWGTNRHLKKREE